jgi:hypothetical protein
MQVPLTAMLTIRLEQSLLFTSADGRGDGSGDGSGDGGQRFIGRLLDKTGRWLLRRDVPAAYLLVRERGAKLGDHLHVLLHLPDLALRRQLIAYVTTSGRFEDAPCGDAVKLSAGRWGMRTAPMSAGALRYCLKSAAADIADALGVQHRPTEPFVGRRFAVSHSIGPGARQAAGWSDAADLDRLRAYLNP